MPRPGPTNLSRPAIFALAMLVWFSLPLGGDVGDGRGLSRAGTARPGDECDGPADDRRLDDGDGVPSRRRS